MSKLKNGPSQNEGKKSGPRRDNNPPAPKVNPKSAPKPKPKAKKG